MVLKFVGKSTNMENEGYLTCSSLVRKGHGAHSSFQMLTLGKIPFMNFPLGNQPNAVSRSTSSHRGRPHIGTALNCPHSAQPSNHHSQGVRHLREEAPWWVQAPGVQVFPARDHNHFGAEKLALLGFLCGFLIHIIPVSFIK